MKKKIVCIVISICMLISCSISVFASSSNAQPRAVTESNFVSGYNDFIAYTTADFPGNNNCGAISSCNMLSYYKMARGCSGLFSGNMVSQDVYNSLYSLVGTTPTGY